MIVHATTGNEYSWCGLKETTILDNRTLMWEKTTCLDCLKTALKNYHNWDIVKKRYLNLTYNKDFQEIIDG